MEKNTYRNQEQKQTEIFWGEIAPCEDLIQMYEKEEAFLDSLASFVSAGIQDSEVVIVIATSAHLKGLESLLLLQGVHTDAASEAGLYMPLEANETLAKFMVYGLPDEIIFTQLITGLIEQVKGGRIRVFGEMTALLWGLGFKSATVKLEELWNSFANHNAFRFSCSYPKYGITQDIKISIADICRKHSDVLAEWNQLETGPLNKSSIQPIVKVG